MTRLLGNFALGFFTLAILIALPAIPGLAQETGGTMGGQGYSAAPNAADSNAARPQVDEATLQRTARAFVKVERINQQENTAVNAAGNDTDRQKVAQQAESQKVAAVQGEGLQPDQYNQVLMLVQADPTLQKRFMTYVDKAS